jgi:hypothetical protein
MRYASPMSSSFVYQPHLRQSGGAIITPDIAIDRVFMSGSASLAPVPVSRLTSATVLQQAEGAPVGAPAIVLVAASYGMVVSVGAILADTLAVAREAWRYDDISAGYGDIVLRSWTLRGGARTAFVSERLGELTPPAAAMKRLGNASGLRLGTAAFIAHPAGLGESLPVDRFEVALEAGDDALRYGFDIEVIRH